MSKGIAIRTILMLLIGVLVVGVVVYLVYSYGTSPTLDREMCRSVVTSWCNSCKVANYSYPLGWIATDSDMEKCIETYYDTGGTDWNGRRCNGAGDNSDEKDRVKAICKPLGVE